MSMGGHQSAAALKDEWLTPPNVIEALGAFDLDPCAPVTRPWKTAAQHYTALDDGLSKPWVGRVWCNPPYGLEAAKWLARCAEHGNAMALIFARTETRMFFDHVWPKAQLCCFLRGGCTSTTFAGSVQRRMLALLRCWWPTDLATRKF